ncbi:MAG TPA: hypothetical protein VF585_02595 [Chthoniobacterales bacterium]
MQTNLQAPGGLLSRTGEQIDRIRINAISRETVAGVPVWVKRRTGLSRLLVPVANGFFWLAGNPVEVFATNTAWQQHEVRSFLLLNGANLQAGLMQDNSVYAEDLPGSDLVHWLDQKKLSPEIMQSVGAAFRKVHQTPNPTTGELFSHGDPHLGNVLYDAAAGLVSWLDFETLHRRGLQTTERHADDLLVLLLDLMGRATEEEWKILSPAFLAAYGQAEVLLELKKRLHPPSGFGAIWWAVRTSYLTRKELRLRAGWLRDQL